MIDIFDGKINAYLVKERSFKKNAGFGNKSCTWIYYV